jgi:hypothetical protein
MGLTAADAVAFLTTNKAISKINFSLLRYKVWPGGYQKHVADAIASPDESKNIHMKASSGLIPTGASASYYAEWDAIAVLPSFNILDPSDQTYFVHECTHALIDIQNLGVVDYHENEAVGFVAEALFSFAAGYTPVGSDPIRLASQAIAKTLLAGSYAVPAADATSLVSTIRISPHYAGRTPIMSNAFMRSAKNNFLRF